MTTDRRSQGLIEQMSGKNPTRRLGRNFATTRWGVIRAAAGEDHTAKSALESLCRDYWAPVNAHIRHRVSDIHLAEDLTQEFFAKFLSQGWFLKPQQERGKFRSFLLTLLRRFLNDEFERAAAWKRGGRVATVSLDPFMEAIIAPENPDTALQFDRAWAENLLHRAFESLKQESDGERFDLLVTFLQREPDHGEYQHLSDRFGITPNTVAAAVKRLRRRLRDHLRDEVSQTLADDEDVDEEMRHLLQLLAA